MSLSNLVWLICHYGIKPEFDLKTLIPKIRRAVKNAPIAYCYSIEISEQDKLHLHLMLVIDTKADHLNPMKVFFHTIRPKLLTLKGIKSCTVFKRRKTFGSKPLACIHHELKFNVEFLDAINRYSYLAKTNDKAKVHHYFSRAFNTSLRNTNNYYSLLGEHNMLKIINIHKSHSFTIFNDTAINARYQAARQFKPDAAAIQQFFHFTDNTTNEIVGYYSLYHCSGVIDGVTDLAIELGDVYITDQTKYENWVDSFYLHLEEQVNKIVSMTDGINQQPIITTYCEDQRGQELLDLVVGTVCLDHEITI